jgi:hypothetical protein
MLPLCARITKCLPRSSGESSEETIETEGYSVNWLSHFVDYHKLTADHYGNRCCIWESKKFLPSGQIVRCTTINSYSRFSLTAVFAEVWTNLLSSTKAKVNNINLERKLVQIHLWF